MRSMHHGLHASLIQLPSFFLSSDYKGEQTLFTLHYGLMSDTLTKFNVRVLNEVVYTYIQN